MEDHDDQELISAEHDHLVSAISKLDKTQHITQPSRNEPTSLNSEFNLIKNTNKVDLGKVVTALKGSAQHSNITNKLKRLQNAQALPKPLEKPQAERIKRATGYEATKEKVGKWDAVVARNRTVDYVSFPLRSMTRKEHPTKIILSKLKSKSPLEKELDVIDPPVEAEEVEDEKSFPMTYEELLEHRKQMAKLRAQQSYKAAKAKRQSKIKSKKYHRILKKEKLKQQLKEFEELQEKDPEEALKKLEELEKARALERHTLRHKNTGKWAKSKLVRAKYDKEVRQQLAEQLAVSRGLTQKTQDTSSTDDEADENEVITDLTLAQDPLNPWMMKRPDKSNVDSEFNFGYKEYLKNKMQENPDSDTEVSENEVSTLTSLKENILKLSNSNDIETPTVNRSHLEVKTKPQQDFKCQNVKIVKQKKKLVAVSTSEWSVEIIGEQKSTSNSKVTEVFEDLENQISKKVEQKLKNLRESIEVLEREPKKENKFKSKDRNTATDKFESLKFKNQNPKPIIDEVLLETNIRETENLPVLDKVTKISQTGRLTDTTQINADIDPGKFIEVKPKYLNTALSKGESNIDDLDDNDEQIVPKVDIEEVFEEDDVVATFRQEKQDEVDNDIPKNIDLELPGWGSWGGMGVKAPKRKRNRFISKPIPKARRRDENKGDVIINEVKIAKLEAHKVSELPFPFTSISDYEASIRVPLGNTFIPETAHKKLIRPNVITKAGTIIEPMDEEQLMLPRNLEFKNQNVIELLAKK
ncbi:unnamed protein product [Leptosia nina]|uniref:U3 small nucleolar RNA-associated protein 14 homolog A n=1 Tax=Leptosia nina TaxID=320188 RepID=A0AAV1K5L0_9NEOP